MAIKRISIYDMDGTIVDSTHRYKTINDNGIEKIDLQYWRDNEYRAYDDSLLPLADQYKADLNDPECYVIIATARIIRDADMRFIKDKLGMPNHIISRRGDSDNRSGGELKVKGLKRFFNLKNFKNAVAVFYEDNTAYLKKVCDTFKITGVYIPSNQGH